MKFLYTTVIFCLLFCSGCSVTKNFNNNELVWNGNNLLGVNNFLGEIDASSEYTAMTYWGIKWRYIESKGWVLYSYFDKYKSWGKKSTYKVLSHEQYHFNIAEVFARILRKSIRDNNMKIESIQFSQFFHLKLQQCKMMQEKYDAETNHSKNKIEQKRWEDEIDKQLDELNFYNSMEL